MPGNLKTSQGNIVVKEIAGTVSGGTSYDNLIIKNISQGNVSLKFN